LALRFLACDSIVAVAYDEALARRVREVIAARAEPAEIRMFGGLCCLVNTHMVAGVTQHGLLLKVGKEQLADAVARGGTQPVMGERVMTGMVRIGEPVLERDGLDVWVLPMVEAALARTPKSPKKPKPRPERS
jgi:TfoX/Sxy family transcriptional regulator of competence genes